MKKFYILTLFPEIVDCYCKFGIVKQAIKKGAIEVTAVDLKKFDPKGRVDDVPYGGVPGMVIKPEPVFKAYESVRSECKDVYVLITEPWGRKVDQRFLEELKERDALLIICGRYEGVDERVKSIVDEEVSLGDMILSGGEIVALALVEGISRLIPGVLGEPLSLKEDSFGGRWLGYPVYTRPRELRGLKVPEVLTSGNHRLIEMWKLWHRIENTLKKRPDLVPKDLTPLEREIVENIRSGRSFEEWIKDKMKI